MPPSNREEMEKEKANTKAIIERLKSESHTRRECLYQLFYNGKIPKDCHKYL